MCVVGGRLAKNNRKNQEKKNLTVQTELCAGAVEL